MGPRVLLIKLGALGDVVRTGALVPGLARLFAEPPHVTWVTAPAALELVERMPGVDRALPYDAPTHDRLRVEKFDAVICLDKEPGPCALAMTVPAEARMGIGLSRYGTPYPLSEGMAYYFRLGLDDEEKFFGNRKSYAHLIYEGLGLDYRGEASRIELHEAEGDAARKRLSALGASQVRRWVGLNPGAGRNFAYKAWREEGYVNLVKAVAGRRPDVGFLLLGGAAEAGLLARLSRALRGLPVWSGGTENTLLEFTALIDGCDLIICGDTLALHLAIARGRRVVALFGPTCEQEIDVFGLGVKIKSPIECSPCYRRACDKSPTCQDLITDAAVVEAALEQLEAIEAVPAARSS